MNNNFSNGLRVFLGHFDLNSFIFGWYIGAIMVLVLMNNYLWALFTGLAFPFIYYHLTRALKKLKKQKTVVKQEVKNEEIKKL